MSAHSAAGGWAARYLPPLALNSKRETKPRSLLQAPVVLEAFLISAAVHVGATAILGIPSGVPTSPFILLLVSDIVLIWLAFIPIVGIRRSLLAWHDPLAYLGIMFLLATATFYCVYLFDPSFVLGYVSFLGDNFSGASETTLMHVFARAMMAQAAYFGLILVFNRRLLPSTYVRVGKSDEAYGATFAGVLLIGLGTYGFLRLRATPFFSQVVDNLGRSMAAPPPGLARYVLLAGVAASAVSLALSGWLNVVAPKQKKLSVWRSVAPAALIAFSMIPAVLVGSRSGIIFAGFVAVATIRHFGYTLSRRLMAALIVVVLVGAFTVSVLRSNPGSESVATRISNPTSIAKIAGTKDRIATLALNMDRTANTALVIRQMDTTGHYLKGMTLVSGWDALAYDYGQRLGLVSSDYVPILTAQQHMEVWRFGKVNETLPVPPGFPGEFYMDGGYLGVLLLGSAFGWLLAFLRRRMWGSSSLTSRWLYVTGLMTVANAASMAQTSVLAGQLGLTIAAVVLTLLLFRLLVRLSWWAHS